MKRKLLFGILFLCLISVGILFFLYQGQNATVMKWKDELKIALCNWKLPSYQETSAKVLEEGKTYRTEQSKTGKRLIDFANGFSVEISENAIVDLSRSLMVTEIKEDDLLIRISREYSTEKDTRKYCSWYFDRFMTDETHLQENGLKLVHPVTDRPDGGYWFSVGGQECYSYAFIPTGTKLFYRILLRYPKEYPVKERMEALLDSFSYFRSEERGEYQWKHSPVIPEEWSSETKEVYRKLQKTDSVYWGIFADKMLTEGIERIIPELEQKLEFSFPVVLYYLPYGDAFPVEFMQKNYEDGKIVELTCQLSGYSNEKLFGFTPQLSVYRGLEDETIRKMARGAKKFGHPFLFRLNNEMNSDWTNYSGVTVLGDPDIYVEVWRRFYRIFQEEGVENAIWIFNPNDRDYPPANWNHFMAYYPGDEYVQMIGVTGYNTGTYYKETKNETWREFDVIYNRIRDRMMPYFSEYPWMITEFSSSSIGGNKERWIRKMFAQIRKYPNIKSAVWFHFADFDPEQPETVARPYWLDETEETLHAFKEGLQTQKSGNLQCD
ncbi:MAG: hypothetical protein E7399_09135 [Ruminococcaceae bacterium]|nr:hypothetical protein [Oscillospiraceae bacterium]